MLSRGISGLEQEKSSHPYLRTALWGAGGVAWLQHAPPRAAPSANLSWEFRVALQAERVICLLECKAFGLLESRPGSRSLPKPAHLRSVIFSVYFVAVAEP